MNSEILSVLQGVLGVAMLGSLLYYFYVTRKKTSPIKRGFPHPGITIVYACIGLSGFLNALKHSSTDLQDGSNMVSFVLAVVVLVCGIFAIAHLYWRAWSALQSADRKLTDA